MLYFIKFIYQTLLLPPGIFIVFLIAACIYAYEKKAKIRKILIAVTIIFYIINTDFFSGMMIRSLEKKHFPPAVVRGDVIIMLGGGATRDTPNVDGEGHLSGYSANRLLTCAQLYNKLHVPVVISGGKVYETTGTEAEIARTILIGLGIPEDKILIDNRSRNTTENAKYCKEIVDKEGFESPILVTSAFHMERAVRQFKKYNVQVTPFPTDYQTNINYNFQIKDLLPSGSAINIINLSLKEYLGILASSAY